MYYIYMLRCRGGSLYTGIAADMEKRLRQHVSGGAACAKYTRSHPPEALAALWQTEDHAAAARLEAFIKTLPPAKKRALAAGEAAPEALFSEKLNGRAYLRRTDEEPRLNALLDALRGTDVG